jgi:SAM-dependent methyltransferase
MTVAERSLDELLAEAAARPMIGWDFSWLGDRMKIEPPGWDFAAMVEERAGHSPDLLDLGTGGGEFLASLSTRPTRIVATEAWPPNVAVSNQRLGPLGVTVVAVESAPDNVDQEPNEPRGRLPFADESFALVVSRHESFVPAEVARVLVPGGVLLTQQVGDASADVYQALELPAPERRELDLEFMRGQLEPAGLCVLESGEGEQRTVFADVGAFAWYLLAIPWIVEGFSVRDHRARLERLHTRGPIVVRQSAFWLEAVRPEER